MFSSSTQGSIVASHVATKLGGLEQSLLPASSPLTVAPFHGFRHSLADLGLAGVKTASPKRLVRVVDNWTSLSTGLSSFKSSLASFYNIPAVGGWGGGRAVITQAPRACIKISSATFHSLGKPQGVGKQIPCLDERLRKAMVTTSPGHSCLCARCDYKLTYHMLSVSSEVSS